MPYSSAWLVTFDGTATSAGAPFDGFTQANAQSDPKLRRNGSGGSDIVGTPSFQSYAYRSAPASRVLFRARVRWKAAMTNYSYLVGARFTGAEQGAGWYKGYHAEIYGANGGTLRILRNGSGIGSQVATPDDLSNATFYDLYIETQAGTTSGTKITAYLCAVGSSIDNPIASVTVDNDTTAELQSTGSVFFAHNDGLIAPPNGRYDSDWLVSEVEAYTWSEETTPPYVGSASVAQDGSGVYVRFVDDGVSPDSGVTGFSFEGRAGSSGSYTSIATGNGAKVSGSSFTYFFPTTGGYVIPRSFKEVRGTYNAATGNLVDTSPNANELASGTFSVANESVMQAATRTGDDPIVLTPRGWCRVESLASTTGMDGQATRELYFPYGAATGTAKIVYQGFTTGSDTLRLKGAGVRIVSPGGAVTTQTLVPTASPVDIPLNEYREYTITSAILPGSIAYVTTLYSSASGGLLPYQNQESIAPRNSGAYDGNGAEIGSGGTLTAKLLLGGTSSGVGHTVPGSPASYVVGTFDQVRTYGPAFVYGTPHPNLSTDITVGAVLAVGNSTMIGQLSRDTGVMFRAFGYDLDETAIPYVVAGQGGSVYSSGVTFLNSTIGQMLVGLVTLGIDGYGHNDLRADGRLAATPYGPEAIPQMLLNQRALVAAPFGSVPVLAWTQTPVDANWMQWDAAMDKLGARLAVQQYNRRLRKEFSHYGLSGLIDIAPVAASNALGNEEGDAGFPGSDLISWEVGVFYSDGIHFPDTFAIAAGYLVRSVVRARLEAPATSSGGGGQLINGGLIG